MSVRGWWLDLLLNQTPHKMLIVVGALFAAIVITTILVGS